ncbi:OLC1v1035234C1 [Oldenlandia corymbosa var. corymbosa]|uniref:Glycosyltransferase n=1 Tax=Oldenlandia corymbosa var. corymbosa TaxID=529605 RepID=A0AAV1CSH3_OLDCO|nr:OLC1v1035234C1 [Oldenlandia corymbosa var. corymbosa]
MMRDSCHIAVLVFPFGSHATPMLNLVKGIAASAPENVKFSFFSTAESSKSIFPGSAAKCDGDFSNIKAYDVWDGVPEHHVFSGNAIFARIGMFLDATPGNFDKAMKEAEEDTGLKLSCLLTDAFLWFSADLAEKHGVPWVPFWTAGSCSLSAHLYTDEIRKLGATTEETVGMIPGFEGLSIDDVPREILLDNEQSPLSLLLHNMALNLPRANAVVVNSFEELDPAITLDLKPKLQNLLNVSPIPLIAAAAASRTEPKFAANHDDECIKWLKKQDETSVVYIGFGSSVITLPPHEMVALAEALETCKSPFLWSLRDRARKSLPAGFVNRTSGFGKLVSWAPQMEVLASGKVGVFVSHGGWNSVLESISFGVPMICRPFFGDHGLNSAMVENKWRAGLKVKDGVFTKNGTLNALELVLNGEKGKELKENVQLIKGLAIDAVKPNGSSMRNFQELLKVITMS